MARAWARRWTATDCAPPGGRSLRFRTVIKPTPTIARPRRTVDLRTGENVTVTVSGRHDPSIVPRAAIVQTAVTALVLYDLLLGDISG